MFPFDALAWTDVTERSFKAAVAAARQAGATGAGVLATTGTITPTAQSELAKLGWTVTRIQ